jgi:fido (protein-threonine AMPylation protein)
MLKRWRLKRIHEKFLESCRTLDHERAYWMQASTPVRWLLRLITPAPLLSLHRHGQSLLEALKFLERNCTQRALRESEVREYHRLVFSDGSELPGTYRTYDVAMKDSKFAPPPFQRVPLKMKQLDLRLAQDQETLDRMPSPDFSIVLRTAVDAYHRISLIHPFGDGNGRVARLGMNHILRRYGAGYIIFPPLGESPKLWDALEAANGGDSGALLELSKEYLHRI